jgi:hypothetical protein
LSCLSIVISENNNQYLQHHTGVACHTLQNKKHKTFMEHVLMPIAIIGSFGTSLYFFTKVLTDYILKKKMIEKGFVNEESQSIFKSHSVEDNKYSSLKWGLIALSGGIALIVMDSLEVRPDSTMPYGIFAVSLSIGFLLYFFLVKRAAK